MVLADCHPLGIHCLLFLNSESLSQGGEPDAVMRQVVFYSYADLLNIGAVNTLSKLKWKKSILEFFFGKVVAETIFLPSKVALKDL